MNARTGWNAAQLASERKLPTPRKMMGPVGDYPDDAKIAEALFVCRHCGHHRCSCERVNPIAKLLSEHPEFAGYHVASWAYMKRGTVKAIPERGVIYASPIDVIEYEEQFNAYHNTEALHTELPTAADIEDYIRKHRDDCPVIHNQKRAELFAVDHETWSEFIRGREGI